MIRVGFTVTTGKWLGGINYIRNLLYAVSVIKNRQIEPIVFLGSKGQSTIGPMLAQHAQVVTTPLLDRFSPAWSLWKSFDILGQGTVILEPFLLKHGIQVLSHSGRVGFRKIKSVNWVPDFQHRHLPEMFKAQEITAWNKWCRMILEKSDLTILSSNNARQDAVAFVPEASSRLAVLQFTAQPDRKIFKATDNDLRHIRQKYSLPLRFCYLPNQFWKHKNHLLAFEALRQLKAQGFEVVLVCSGPMEDPRNPRHADRLKRFILEHQLEKNILLLGQIPFDDVGLLYAACTVVMNPSLFEGWSTSVEESKSMGKRILLSDIPVHREQAPAGGIYFDPHDASDLALKIKAVLGAQDAASFLRGVKDLEQGLDERTRIFGEAYQDLIVGVVR